MHQYMTYCFILCIEFATQNLQPLYGINWSFIKGSYLVSGGIFSYQKLIF